MDTGSISAIVSVIGFIATYVGAGDLVPMIGPAVQGALPIITLLAGVWSWWQHRQKSATIAAGVH